MVVWSAYFFMTCRLTFCMSTFWANSGGNLVDFMSRASPPDAIVGGAAAESAGCGGKDLSELM